VQKPIRYYITKSGEEPTVRSVKVALNPVDREPRVETVAVPEQPSREQGWRRSHAVSRLVEGAIRRRPRATR
jgi:hypothetical protein